MTSSVVIRKAPAAEHPQIDKSATSSRRLRLVSYNIQVAVASTRLRHYLTQSWKHFLPHPQSFSNLDNIAEIVRPFDIVALQEADAGSIRSQFVNQVQYLAEKGDFQYWYSQTNRNLGKLAQASNGLLSTVRPTEVVEHKLPGFIPGRGALFVRYGHHDNPLVLLLVHLALGKKARLMQLAYIAELANQYNHVVLMGDLNCLPQSQEIRTLLRTTNLSEPLPYEDTFPSWKPCRKLDYILVSHGIHVNHAQVVKRAVSDHLPVAIEVTVPDGVQIIGLG